MALRKCIICMTSLEFSYYSTANSCCSVRMAQPTSYYSVRFSYYRPRHLILQSGHPPPFSYYSRSWRCCSMRIQQNSMQIMYVLGSTSYYRVRLSYYSSRHLKLQRGHPQPFSYYSKYLQCYSMRIRENVMQMMYVLGSTSY